jgi:hypothetical protein
MSFIYSKTTGGFYPVEDQAEYEAAGTWPTDGVEVTHERREALYGKTVVADANGFPVAYVPSLQALQAAQIGQLAAGYAAAIAQPVNFTTAAGVTKTFQADQASIQNLSSMLAAFTPAGAVPSGFYWVAADNTKVPFTLVDMQGLAAALGSQGWDAFQRLQQRKAAVLAASSAPSIAAVIW